MNLKQIGRAALAFNAACVVAAAVGFSLQTAFAAEVDDPGGIFAQGAKLTRIVGEPEGFFYEGPAMGHDRTLWRQ